ncbi:4Fe-4S binding protein, partial [Campylobacter jejuni]
AIDVGADGLVKVEVDPNWKNLELKEKEQTNAYKGTEFVEKIVKPMNAAKGDDLPVSAFLGYEDGSFEHGTTEYEKRGVGVMVPRWIEANCIQCNQCASVCPHAVIRPFLINDEEMANAPRGVKDHALEAKGTKGEKLSFK